jgi:hypothetical protein
VVTDRNGAVIVTSEASLLGADDKPIRTESVNNAGEIVVTGLPLGFSRFRVAAPYFQPLQLGVAIRSGSEQVIKASLEVVPLDQGQHVETALMPSPQALDPAPAPSPKPAKRRWWQIFR